MQIRKQMQSREFRIDAGPMLIDAGFLSRAFVRSVDGALLADHRPKVFDVGEGVGSIGVMNVSGVLLSEGEGWYRDFGYLGYNILSEDLRALMEDSRVKTIVMKISSPGGSAIGASEMATEIFNARATKRIVAVASPYAFSAAYEIASQASELWMMGSGMVGSVGAYMQHLDWSEYLKDIGISSEFIFAGEKKVDGNEFEPLSERARGDLQREVDFYYDLFVNDVARGRGVSVEHVTENFGRGGRMLSTDAVRVGAVDGVATLAQVLVRERERLRKQSESDFVVNSLLSLKLED